MPFKFADIGVYIGGPGLSPDIGHNGGPPIIDWPTWESTGPSGTLTPMSGEIRMWAGDGSTVLENVDLDGWIIIQSPNCKIRNCRIRTNGGDFIFSCVRIDWGSGGSEVGLEIVDCEMDGMNNTVNGFNGDVDFSLGMINCRMKGIHNGINTGSGWYKGNFIEVTLCLQEDAHYDPLEVNGIPSGYPLLVEDNVFWNQVFQTSGAMFANFFTGLQGLTFQRNWVTGGGYTLYVDPRFGGGVVDAETILISENKMGAGGYGYWALYDTGVTPVGNYDEVTGANCDP